MRLTAWASEVQYLDHLAPVWRALDSAERGRFHVTARLAAHAAALGIPAHEISLGAPPRRQTGPVLVASWQDSRRVRPRPRVYLEHGSGQAYRGDARSAEHPSYSGSPGHEGTILFLCPREEVAARWRRRYPDVPAVAVGCPKLDTVRPRHGGNAGAAVEPIVAISFHADLAHVCPEARSTWQHHAAALPKLRDEFKLLGHAHPRLSGAMRRRYRELEIGYEPDFARVLGQAHVYAVDNSSTMFEAAAAGIPVVVLNAPWYRRHVYHGGRFWDYADLGPTADHSDELPDAVADAVADSPARAAYRRQVAEAVYGSLDGQASRRAVEAIRATITGGVMVGT
jgi:hypothetical protein